MSALLSFGKQTSLPGITDFQFVVDMVEDAAFFQAPERCDQQIARTVHGLAVDRVFVRVNFQTVDHKINVFFFRLNVKSGLPIIICQIGVFQHMEQLQLDAVNVVCI